MCPADETLCFTSPIYPMPSGVQPAADWPELDAGTVTAFNKWYDPDVQAEIVRRASLDLSMAYSDEVYLPHCTAGARMELVRYARLHRGEHVSVRMFGFHGGMKLE